MIEKHIPTEWLKTNNDDLYKIELIDDKDGGQSIKFDVLGGI